jgi:peroxiredoxin
MKRFLATVRENFGLITLFVVLIGSLSANVQLALLLRPAARQSGVRVGTDINFIPTVAKNGAKSEVRLGDGHWSIIYIMSPSCVWCARNLKNASALATMTKNSKYRFIGLSTTNKDLEQYIAAKAPPFPIIVADKDHLPKGLDLSSTPQTVVVGPDGIVKKVWQGAFSDEGQADVEHYFTIKLPGLIAPGV